MSVGADNPSYTDTGFNIFMLMAVKHELRLGSLHVMIECRKPNMHFIVAVVD